MKPIHRNYSESSSKRLNKIQTTTTKLSITCKIIAINSIQTDSKATPSFKPSALQTLTQGDNDDDDDEEAEEEELAFQLQKRLNPRKQEDFAVLQSELLQWRRREERKILITCGNIERKRELTKALLIKETCLLRKIEALKNEAHSKVKANKVEQSISKMAQPKTWETSYGDVIVETPVTSLAREMKGIHDDVRKKIDKTPARIDLLQRIKLCLHRMHSSTTLVKDILVLVNRETEILQRDTAELGNDMLEE
ncbi:hypothetical protein QTG54_016834 [Skeletonema marinoi]|uniref:IQ motif and ubiquitin-like domain-containing protein n=1 Tax=Skeletonema marinoi TaxID=267567 RepID=A0AAD8XS23_9STRA|nr:hypothetical protein QTG54_016834 [Skeletonema marinoi]